MKKATRKKILRSSPRASRPAKELPPRSALLEIGMEEMPARFMPDSLAQLKDLISKGLVNSGLEFTNVEVYGSPRRLAAIIHGLAARSKDREDVAIGPPPKAAKDEKGEWTQAALGFARAQNVPVDKLIVRETPKGERLAALHQVKGVRAEDVLKDLFPAAIKSLTFPKSMVWNGTGFRFARPVRWFVALYHTKVIRFELAELTSDRTTIGLLSLGGLRITIPNPDKYKSVLQGRCILVDPADRRKNIQTQLDAVAKRLKATIVADEDHLEEVVHLTEYPVGIVGHFPEDYLRLPPEILVVVLKKQQKYFPIASGKGGLTNAFVGFRNGTSESQDEVRDGYERVINARLSDAKFFFEKDSKLSLAELAPKLSGVGFHEKLGSMWDKTVRVQKLVKAIGESLGLNNLEDADRAALVAKSDLLTQMVGEFPELQGVAGRFYAEKLEKPEVAQAIEQHYWPLTAEGKLPETELASLVAVADKMDTLAANFSVGLVPSGSADPYGLRRASIGILRILLERNWNMSLELLIKMAFTQLGASNEKAQRDLEEFFRQRCLNWFAHQGYRTDEIEAVAAIPNQSLSVISEKLRGLKSVRNRQEFSALAAAIKRARNILAQASEKGLLPSQREFQTGDGNSPVETTLHGAIQDIGPRTRTALDRRDYSAALLELAALKAPIDAFFEGTMIMVEDEHQRSQRLRLLLEVKDLFDAMADFSRLQSTPSAAVSAGR